MVLFRTSMVTSLVSDSLFPGIFGLPADEEVRRSAFFVLTSEGRGWVSADGSLSWRPSLSKIEESLANRHAERLALMPDAATADCVGLGTEPGEAPVLVAIHVADHLAEAEALFDRQPDERHYDLLTAAGVRYRGGEPAGTYWRARFVNELPTHLLAGALSGFQRTGLCNAFFLKHGRVDDALVDGLRRAAGARIKTARSTALAVVCRMASRIRHTPVTMTCVPPAADAPSAYGDIVPAGFVLAALETSAEREQPAVAAAATLVRRYLDRHRVSGLWSFHAGGLPTATDSALTLLGFGGGDDIEQLEQFSDGAGGYLPQLSAPARDERHMERTPDIEHWCQSDLGTTCLIRALRSGAGLASRTPLDWLRRRFTNRSTLYFANPYLTDWALALAIQHDADAADLRDRLSAEVSNSVNPDGSFGQYDRMLSTALAVLTLGLIGAGGPRLRSSQLWLATQLAEPGFGPPATPFYSTQRMVDTSRGQLRGPTVLRCNGQWHALTVYEDSRRAIVASLAAQALAMPADGADHAVAEAAAHPRYRATSLSSYVEQFALPPYLEAHGARGTSGA